MNALGAPLESLISCEFPPRRDAGRAPNATALGPPKPAAAVLAPLRIEALQRSFHSGLPVACGSPLGPPPRVFDPPMSRIARELWLFLRTAKKWWITSLLLYVAAIVGVAVLLSDVAVPSFIYPIF